MKWTPEEECILIDNLGEMSYDEIAALIEKVFSKCSWFSNTKNKTCY